MSDDLVGSSFLQTDNNYFYSNKNNISFAVEEEDPWSVIGFDPVDEIRQPLSKTQAMDEELVTEGITAANVLVGIDLPEIYDNAYIRAGPIGDRVNVETLEAIIQLGGVSPRLFEQITALAVPSGALYVTRNEFNTALALLACAQKNMELSLIKVYQHRNDLPVPSLPNLNTFSVKRTNPLIGSNPKPKQSFVDDPWRISSTPPSTFPDYEPENSVDLAIQQRKLQAAILKTPEPEPVLKKPLDLLTDKVSTQALVKASTESYQWFSDLDQVTVQEAEREGFLFTHVNYWVQSAQRNTTVKRRYSDFYWFWEILSKRYPYRIIPNLPPKQISGKSKTFLDLRLQGLSRFINCIVRHPVLKNDEEVVNFLTEQSEFIAWRKAKTPDLNEEFDRVNPQTEELETFIPKDLDTRLEHIQKRLPKSIEKYDYLCYVMDRSIRLKAARAAELKKYSNTLKELRDIEHECFVPNCQACKQTIRGYESVGNYLEQDSKILETETEDAIKGVLESLKRHRDISISFLEMLDRKSKLEQNQISALQRKISANTAKVNQNRGVPGLESEVERLDALIKVDTEKMVYQQRKETYVRYCAASELSYLHKQQAFVSLLYQNFVHEQLQYSRKAVDNWKALETHLYDLPSPEDFA